MPRAIASRAVTNVDFGQLDADAVALPVAHPFENLDSRLESLAESGELRGKRGEAVLLHDPRLVAAGVGARDEVDADALRTAGSAAGRALSRVGGTPKRSSPQGKRLKQLLRTDGDRLV